MNFPRLRSYLVFPSLMMLSCFCASLGQAKSQSVPLNAETRTNILKAMEGEAFAYAKYMSFAKKAREEGKPQIAKLFEDTARMEITEHFVELAELYGLVGTSSENLKNAIDGEKHETSSLYPQFAAKASAVGDEAAAARFTELAEDEAKHAQSFQQQLNLLLSR